jgi:hypothetical protein
MGEFLIQDLELCKKKKKLKLTPNFGPQKFPLGRRILNDL